MVRRNILHLCRGRNKRKCAWWKSIRRVCNVTYLPLHGEEDGPSGGVVEHPVAPDAEKGALGLQHDGAVSVVVGDGEVAAGEAHVLGHRQRCHVRRAELRGHHRHRHRHRCRWRRQRQRWWITVVQFHRARSRTLPLVHQRSLACWMGRDEDRSWPRVVARCPSSQLNFACLTLSLPACFLEYTQVDQAKCGCGLWKDLLYSHQVKA